MSFTIFTTKDDKEDADFLKREAKRAAKESKELRASQKARVAAVKFLEENPHVNVGYVIKHLQNMILTTVQCCAQLQISPKAFARLRKKYNIEPVHTIKNTSGNAQKRGTFRNQSNRFCVKNFYSPNQLD